MKKIFILLVMIFPLVLTACGSGIPLDQAKATANEFFGYISEGKYTEAEALLHPDIVLGDGLQTQFEQFESWAGVDLSKGMSFKTTGFHSSVYDTEYGGAHVELEGMLQIDGKSFEAEIEFIKRDNVFGIYNFDID